ncbi:sugar phosphate isomerase/epimerase family protein [Aestuariimicrobium ganziense]|uniref:sugar phosphate isomerase/epimerase family protein n=1 Tax=Aestuariimicrobium ganziense TaxID=2773677 RepID=UPI00194099D8|nr:TIM barrel protein [Aestuariimicrobium ganziense]
MRLGLSSFTYPWAVGIPGHQPEQPWDAHDLIEATTAAGLGLLQLADNVHLEELSSSQWDEVVDHARQSAVTLEVGTRGIGAQLATHLAMAVDVGASFVRVVVSQGDDRPGPQEALDRLAPYAQAFRDAGIVLAIENHDDFTVAELCWLVERLEGWGAVCLDTVNSLGALEDPPRVVEALSPLTVNLHIKDVTIGRHPSHLGFSVTGTPAGSGMLDLASIVETVGSTGRCHTAILELWTPLGDDLSSTVSQEADWARSSVEHLLTLPGLQR